MLDLAPTEVTAMKRKLAWIAAGAGVILCLTGLFRWFSDPVTLSNWQQIRIGMTQGEVEAILGRAGLDVDQCHEATSKMSKIAQITFDSPRTMNGIELTRGRWDEFSCLTGVPEKEMEEIFRHLESEKCWLGPRGGIVVVRFDDIRRVAGTRFMQWRLTEPTLRNRARVFLRL